jgi:uncharacterized membrane protein
MTIIPFWKKTGTDCTLIHALGRFDNRRMEKKTRMLMKAITWQLIGFTVMSGINSFYMGDWRQGLGLSALLTVIGLVSYYLHEQLWARIRWGRL